MGAYKETDNIMSAKNEVLPELDPRRGHSAIAASDPTFDLVRHALL